MSLSLLNPLLFSVRTGTSGYSLTLELGDASFPVQFRPLLSYVNSRLPLTKGTHLTWIAYTNRGRIVAQSSDSVIRLLVCSRDFSSPSFWTPIFDGTEALTSLSDSIWPVSVVENTVMQLRYIYCRGVKYPMVTLKWTPIIASWSIPLCNKASDKTKEEEALFLNELALSAVSDAAETEIKDLSASHLKSVIKLFVLAMKRLSSEMVTRRSGALRRCGRTMRGRGMRRRNHRRRRRSIELKEKYVLKFGFSSREYVILTENALKHEGKTGRDNNNYSRKIDGDNRTTDTTQLESEWLQQMMPRARVP